jgi:tellurite resistance protein
MKTISQHAALIHVMVIVSASDGSMSARELRAIEDMVKRLPVFHDFDDDRLDNIVKECATMLREPEGFNVVVARVKEALPDHLRETAYFLGLEVALADNRVALEEIRVLEALRRNFGIDKLVAAALERGARARYQVS